MDEKLNTLIIEDSITFTKIILLELKKLGYDVKYKRVDTKEGMEEALNESSWDVILCDHVMPGFNSFEALVVLNRTELDIPLIIVSGEIDEEKAIKAMQMGCRDYILKNNLSRLGPVIHRELHAARIRNKSRAMGLEIAREKEFLKITLQSIGDGVITTDDTGKILLMNSAAEELTGYSQIEAGGKELGEVFKIIDKKSGRKMESPFTVTIRKGSKSGLKSYTALISRDCTERYVSASSAPIRDAEGNIIGVVVVFRDITRIKKAEEEVEREQKNLRAIFEAAPVGMLLLDENAVIRQINDFALKIFGRSFDELIGKRIGSGFDCQGASPNNTGCGFSSVCGSCVFWSVISVAFDTGEAIRGIEILHEIARNEKVEKRWVKVSAVPVILDGKRHVTIVIDDISENKKNEEGLKRYQILSEKARDIIFFVDTDGFILEANDATSKVYGYEKEEMIGKHVSELRSIQCREKVTEHLKLADTEGILFETEHLRKNGSTFPVEVSAQGTYIGKKRVILSIIRDITERKKAERELKLAKEAAEAASKAKSEFLTNMSHEIRTPLNGIIGMTDLTLMTNLSKEQQENLKIIKSCADTLHSVINDILDLSKIEAGKMIIENISFDLKKLLENTAKPHYNQAISKGLNFVYLVDSTIPQILTGDPKRLQQVLNNLIGNAIKFTDNGEVKIIVEQYSSTEDGTVLKFAVSDTGIGIAEEEKKQLFQNFSQVDGSITRKYGGTGLGLAISKNLITMMEGDIWVNSEKGKGSTFYFTLKFGSKNDRLLDSRQEQNPVFQKVNNSLSILLVEDDKVNQMVTTQLLDKKGYIVDVADNGLEALDKFRRKRYDAIIMDIQMPEMDGIETTRRIRKMEEGTDRHTPIIAFTAFALQGDRERFMSEGMDYYVSKPIDMDKLLKPLGQLEKSEKSAITESYNNVSGVLGSNNTGETLDGYKKVFIHDLYLHLKRIKSALDEKNFLLVERYAQDIKVSSTKLDVSSIKNIAFKIQMAARKDDIVGISGLLEKLACEIEKYAAETEGFTA